MIDEAAGRPPGSGVRVRVHPGVCEGWGLCHRFGGHVYPLDGEGFVDLHLLEVPPELAEAARQGASVCPAQAITVIETASIRRG
jgi:ferredoxin